MNGYSELVERLRELAYKYNNKGFIEADPVQFAWMYDEKKDVEIAAVVAQWIAYGNRKAIVKKGEELMEVMGESPYIYIMSGEWGRYEGDDKALYRFYKWKDFYDLCERLMAVYADGGDLEERVVSELDKCGATDYSEGLYAPFAGVNGFPDPKLGSAAKRLNMMLRWMVRRDGIVDRGVWKMLSPEKLVIPVDVHVMRQAQNLGITNRKTADRKTAMEITAFMRNVFPNDPCLGDYALFGLGAIGEK